MSETIARFGIAGVAGCGASCCVHPLDVVRINLQIDQAGARVYKNTFHCLSHIFKKGGINGLYAGLSAGMLRQITYGMPRMAFVPILYDKVRSPGENNLPLYKKLFCGAVAGGTASVIGVPSEVSLVRMSGDQKLAMTDPNRRNYTSVFNALRRIAAEEGVGSLWKGATPTIARAILLNMGQMPVASQAKEIISEKTEMSGIPLKFSSAMVASVFAVGFSCPADVIKSRMQNMQTGEYTGPLDCAKKLIRSEGALALYKGYTPAFIKLAPHTVISFIILDTLSQIILGKDIL
jgi:solute carrier family 25 (mitochondrial oxoglutarate transporter), member 11